ncbi:MAG: proline dehydrogenase family protein, partial [Acidimicrobiia bacterium]|nr:proline dehydrogenase family protein [Acidimicrobiia bacterium]
YGMAEPIHRAVNRLGLRLRVYAPVGDLLPGMAYLVRRLLENTANESFVRRRFVEGRELDELLAPPDPELVLAGPGWRSSGDPAQSGDAALPADVQPAPDPPGGPSAVRSGDYQPEPVAEWRDRSVREAFGKTIDRTGERLNRRDSQPVVPAIIGGRKVMTTETIASVDPAEPSTVVALSPRCGPGEAEEALAVALEAWPAWAATPAAQRAGVVFRAAAWMRQRRHELAALEVVEAGKPWPDADADVCEAIDFCEFYGRQMLRLDAGGQVASPAGESNALRYRGRGVGVVISPWNFPLAIPAGMVAAALVTGNAVIFKPAEQTPAVAAKLVEAFTAAGLPEGVLNFLPGLGEEVGAPLVEHPAVSFVVFTGSLSVGLGIVEAAAAHRPGQRQVKRVVAEMGGKNAVIVDADADLDQAVPIVVASAFGYSGQKCSACSRLIVVDSGGGGAEQLVERLVGRAQGLRIGHPREMGVDIGPLIDSEAQGRVRSYVEAAGAEGKVVLARDDVPATGFFVGPTIVTDVAPDSRLATEEIFGPVLAVMRVDTFDEALDLANRTDYALTAGVVSRSPSHIERAVQELRAGNIYVNRAITGAVVGRQPFGGFGLSGVGSKAGGPDYLLQFVDPVTVSENTLRQGFAPGDGD